MTKAPQTEDTLAKLQKIISTALIAQKQENYKIYLSVYSAWDIIHLIVYSAWDIWLWKQPDKCLKLQRAEFATNFTTLWLRDKMSTHFCCLPWDTPYSEKCAKSDNKDPLHVGT